MSLQKAEHVDEIVGWLLFASMTIAITIVPYKVPGNFLTYDGKCYLEYAQLFKDGDLFNLFIQGDLKNLGIWPLGFPISVGLIAFIFGVDPFLAARITQTLFLIIFIFLLKILFKKNWVFYFSLLATGFFLANFQFPLSEAGFIVFGLGIIMVLECIENTQRNIMLILLTLLLFSYRYMGLFIIPYFFAYWVFIDRNKKIVIPTLLLGVIAVLNYSFIKIQTGYFSGIERKGGIIERMDLLKQFFVVSLGQFSYFDLSNFHGKIGGVLFFIGLIPFIILLIALIRKKNILLIFKKLNLLSKSLILYGSTYLIFYFFLTVGLGWDHDGEGITSRFVYPGMIFIILGIFHQVAFLIPVKQVHKYLLYIFSILSNLYYALSGLYLYK
ncbi:MAG: hypothetical protein ACXIUD_11735 [Mongoliitalea sp.]